MACGIAMLLEIEATSTRAITAPSLPEVEIGVGIASGEVLVGGIGRGEGLRLRRPGRPGAARRLIERAARPGSW